MLKFLRLLRRLCCSCYCCCCFCCCDDDDDDEAQKRGWRPTKEDIHYVLPLSDEETISDAEEDRLLKKGRSSSLKSELYRQIWQRRSVWARQKSVPSFQVQPIEFWSGSSCHFEDQEVQPRSSIARKPPYKLMRGISVESLQPQLYDTPTESFEEVQYELTIGEGRQLGEIHFSCVYDFSSKVLAVKIIEARHLPLPGSVTPFKKDQYHSNPYVRVCLLPDQKDSRQTVVHRKTQNPVFNEIFLFELNYREVSRRTLLLKIQDFDKYSRHFVLGQVLVPLCDVNVAKGVHLWRRILPSEKDLPDLGEILLSLAYLPAAGRLNVDVLRAKQLLQTDLVGGSVPYVKVSLVVAGKHIKTKKTTHKKNTINPVWGETISFNVTAVELDELSLVISVWDYNGGIVRDDFIGRIVLGKYATGAHEITHWSNMLHAERSSVAQWNTLRSREECDQMSAASRAVP